MGGEGQIESQRGGERHLFCPENKKHGRKVNFAATWWRRVDSNHRSETQQIYSLPHLPALEFPHLKTGAGGRIRTPDLLITNQLLYRLSYTSTCQDGCPTARDTITDVSAFVKYYFERREKKFTKQRRRSK